MPIRHSLHCLRLVNLQRELYGLGARGISIDAADEFQTKVENWTRTALPESFWIDFRGSLTSTLFPDLDLTIAQACDIHIRLNTIIIKIWLPFMLQSNDHNTAAPRQTAEICAKSARAIVLASAFALQRFRQARPARFGSYWFARSMFLAATVLGSILIEEPDAMYADAAKSILDLAIDTVFKDSIVCGSPSTTITDDEEAHEVVWLLEHIREMANRVQLLSILSTGSKRKTHDSAPLVEAVTIPTNFRVPFAGSEVLAASTEVDIVYAPPQNRDRQAQASVTLRDNVPGPPSMNRLHISSGSSTVPARSNIGRPGGRSEDMSAGSGGDGGHTGGGRTRRKTNEHVLGAEGDYSAPAAASYPPPAPSSNANLPKGSTRRPRAGSSGSSHVARPVSIYGGKALPAIGVRDRTKQNLTSSSSTNLAKYAGKAEEHAHAVRRAASASSKAMNGKASKRMSLPSQASAPDDAQRSFGTASPSDPRPPSVVTNPMPPPAPQSAAPQPTYYQPPSNTPGQGFGRPHSQSVSTAASVTFPPYVPPGPPQHNEGMYQGQPNPHAHITPHHVQQQHALHSSSSAPDFRPLLSYEPPAPSHPTSQPPISYGTAAAPSQPQFTINPGAPHDPFGMQNVFPNGGKSEQVAANFGIGVDATAMGFPAGAASGPMDYSAASTTSITFDQFSNTANPSQQIPSNAGGHPYNGDSAMDAYTAILGGGPQRPPQQQQFNPQQYGNPPQVQPQYAPGQTMMMPPAWNPTMDDGRGAELVQEQQQQWANTTNMNTNTMPQYNNTG